MPSSLLGDQVPHSLLFPNQPLFCLPPRVFGCTCFVHILTPGQDKLFAKAAKCIFISYSCLQHGYSCYSPDAHRYFVSSNVTFLNILLSSLPHHLPVPRFYLYLSSFPFWPYHLSPQLLPLVHYKFILVICILTLGLLMTHLLWRPPPQCQSCRLPLILPSPFGSPPYLYFPVLSPFIFIIICFYLHLVFCFSS